MNRLLTVLLFAASQLSPSKKVNAQLSQGRYANNIPPGSGPFSADKLYEKKQWAAKWIWLDRNSFPQYQRTSTAWISPGNRAQTMYRALFRKSFTLQKLSRKGIIFITADVHFQVYVNDSLAGAGPVNIGSDYGDTTRPAYWYYSSFDVHKWLKKGTNTIAVVVNGWGMESSETTSSYGRLLCELDSEKGILEKSDSKWKAMVDTSYSEREGILQFNAKLEPLQWTTTRFNDASWPKTTIQGEVNAAMLFCNKLPPLLKEEIPPVQVVTSDSGWLLDYGKNIPAHISFSFDAAASDTVYIVPFEKSAQQPNRRLFFICRQGHNEYYSPLLHLFVSSK